MQLVGLALENQHTAAGRLAEGLGHEAGLADPCLPFNEGKLAPAGRDPIEQPAQSSELGRPPEHG